MLVISYQLNNFKGTDLFCMFNVNRFILINNDLTILRFQVCFPTM